MTNTVNVYVASTSEIKINAVRLAFEKFYPGSEVVVKGYKCASDVNEQPLGIVETLTGAANRLERLIRSLPGKANGFFVSMENGVDISENDFGVVMISGPDYETHIGETVKVKFPHEDFVEAKRLGFDKHTVGSVMAERLGKPEVDTDPHFYLTGKHRQEYLEEAVTQILKENY